MKIDERHLVQLAAVAETGGVTEGAAMLGMTQPAVSRTLSMLERRVGEPLFIPGKRPMQLTPLGQQLAIQGRSILGASRKAVEIVRSFLRVKYQCRIEKTEKYNRRRIQQGVDRLTGMQRCRNILKPRHACRSRCTLAKPTDYRSRKQNNG